MEIQGEMTEWLNRITHWKKSGLDQSALALVHHVKNLQDFLNILAAELGKCENVEDCLQKFPQVGQLLGHICSVPVLWSDVILCEVLLHCVIWFYVSDPKTSLQKKSSTWAMSQMRGMTSYKKDSMPQVPLHMTGLVQADFHNLALEETSHILDLESHTHTGQPSGFKSAMDHPKKIIDWIKFCMAMSSNDWFRNFLPRLLQLLIKRTDPTNAETDNLLSYMTKTQEGAYTDELAINLGEGTLHVLWNNYPISLEQEILSLLEFLCQQPHIDNIDVPSLLELRGLAQACQNSPYVQGTVIAMIKQLQLEGADFTLKIALQKLEDALNNFTSKQ